jgi:hypothetical protein
VYEFSGLSLLPRCHLAFGIRLPQPVNRQPKFSFGSTCSPTHRSYLTVAALKPYTGLQFASAASGPGSESVAIGHQTFHTCDARETSANRDPKLKSLRVPGEVVGVGKLLARFERTHERRRSETAMIGWRVLGGSRFSGDESAVLAKKTPGDPGHHSSSRRP